MGLIMNPFLDVMQEAFCIFPEMRKVTQDGFEFSKGLSRGGCLHRHKHGYRLPAS
jgi:hypothetical protein